MKVSDLIDSKYHFYFSSCREFSIGKGWYGLVNTLCKHIESILERYNLSLEKKISIDIVQVKQKFGGLRFYYHLQNITSQEVKNEIRSAVRFAEQLSFIMCEICGKPGSLCEPQGKFGVATRCYKHKDYHSTETPKKRKGSISLDFDGVINSYSSGFVGIDKLPDPPVKGSIEYIQTLVERGFKVYIYSTRNEQEKGKQAIKKYLEAHGLPPKILKKVGIVSGKPKSKLYIDDRAWEFDGVFPDPQELECFTPWHGGTSSTQKG